MGSLFGISGAYTGTLAYQHAALNDRDRGVSRTLGERVGILAYITMPFLAVSQPCRQAISRCM